MGDNTSSLTSSNWGLVIFLIILFAVFWSGGMGFGPNRAYAGPMGFADGVNGYGFEDYKAICEAQKQNIANTATTQYLTEQQAAATRELIAATSNATQAKIDFYAYQGLRDELSKSQMKVAELQNQLFVKEQLAPISSAIADVRCNMLPKPALSGVAAVCPNSAVINGLGISNLNGLGCGSCGPCGTL